MCVCLQAVYTTFVPEDIPVSSVLLRVGATDADVGVSAWIQYSLHGPGSQDFSMDPDTGKNKDTDIVVVVVVYCISSNSVKAETCNNC